MGLARLAISPNRGAGWTDLQHHPRPDDGAATDDVRRRQPGRDLELPVLVSGRRGHEQLHGRRGGHVPLASDDRARGGPG